MSDGLVVRSHVKRDLLQSAAVFKHEPQVVWEYVSNELQYSDPGTSPSVKVRLDRKGKRISIQGNGRGMDWNALENEFFVMHGENVDRKAGRPGRGLFGTGKSAAFGIGDVLRLTTVRSGKRSKVELRRRDIDALQTGDPIPVRTLEQEEPASEANGTLVEIEDIHLKSMDQAGVISYVERHLAHWRKDVTVMVNNHVCEVHEPPVERIETFHPSGSAHKVLGEVELKIKVSKGPLNPDLRGISIFSKGVWHETTLLGSEGKEMAEFIFGEVEVPRLDEDESTPPALDLSRSMQLNPHNEVVSAIYAFVGPHLEEVRKQLVTEQRAEQETEEARRLQHEADQIENIINQDFERFRKRLQKVKAASPGPGIDLSDEDDEDGGGSSQDDDFLYSGDEPATVVTEEGEPGGGEEEEGNQDEINEPQRLNPIVAPDEEGEETGRHEGGKKRKRRPRGGFHIEFRNQGKDSDRAEYQSEKRTIYINLEHPQIAAAKQSRRVDDPTFRRLVYEVAFFEYAVALAHELDNRGELIDSSEAIFEVRDAVNRVARQGAALYG
jgi:hypothetical protein